MFDALTHRRPYKAPWPLEEAVAEILGGSMAVAQEAYPRANRWASEKKSLQKSSSAMRRSVQAAI